MYFSIDLMSRVKIVIPILKNCLVNHDRFKRHILCFELKNDVLERGFSKRLEAKPTLKKRWEEEHRKLYIAADVDASWEKVKRARLYSTDTTFTQHKVINILKRPSHCELRLANSCWQTQVGVCQSANTFYLSPTVCQRVCRLAQFRAVHTHQHEFANTSLPTK